MRFWLRRLRCLGLHDAVLCLDKWPLLVAEERIAERRNVGVFVLSASCCNQLSQGHHQHQHHQQSETTTSISNLRAPLTQ